MILTVLFYIGDQKVYVEDKRMKNLKKEYNILKKKDKTDFFREEAMMKNYTKALAEQIVAVMDRYNNYEELEKIVICYGTVVVSRWCICNAKCHCRNTPAGYSSNFNTAALLGDYSTA